MKQFIEKADILIEALPFIQRFRGDVIVVKFGGSAMEERSNTEGVLTDITFMECVDMLPVLVHGGGKAISRALKERGVESKFVKGLRVTDEKTMEVVHDVLSNVINVDLVQTLSGMGARAQGVMGEQIFAVVKKEEPDGDTGGFLDLGFVGDPLGVDTGPIRELLAKDVIPVVTPVGKGPDGHLYNINADDAATALAKALKARKLAFLSDVPGLMRDPKDPESILTTLRVSDIEELINRGIIAGGMLPKVRSGIEALKAGVKKVHIVDGGMPHSLLLEILTNQGVGTEIVDNE